MSPGERLKQGEKVDYRKINEMFRCSWSGGMNLGKKTNSLVLFSNHLKSIYNDRWVDDNLYYTGMGQKGDQVLEGNQNKTLYESRTNGVRVHLFEVFEKGIYTYQGPIELSDEPFQEEQLDKDGNERIAWVFPLRLKKGATPLILSKEDFQKKEDRGERRSRKLSDEELAKRAQHSSENPGSRKVTGSQYERNPYVAEMARRRANGHCDLCGEPAPFKKKNGEPFLEVHHITWLSNGGPDTVQNTVALCPNCHRRMHSLDRAQDITLLRQKAGSPD